MGKPNEIDLIIKDNIIKFDIDLFIEKLCKNNDFKQFITDNSYTKEDKELFIKILREEFSKSNVALDCAILDIGNIKAILHQVQNHQYKTDDKITLLDDKIIQLQKTNKLNFNLLEILGLMIIVIEILKYLVPCLK